MVNTFLFMCEGSHVFGRVGEVIPAETSLARAWIHPPDKPDKAFILPPAQGSKRHERSERRGEALGVWGCRLGLFTIMLGLFLVPPSTHFSPITGQLEDSHKTPGSPVSPISPLDNHKTVYCYHYIILIYIFH